MKKSPVSISVDISRESIRPTVTGLMGRDGRRNFTIWLVGDETNFPEGVRVHINEEQNSDLREALYQASLPQYVDKK